jgi:ATP-binding cassette subfamily B protein
MEAPTSTKVTIRTYLRHAARYKRQITLVYVLMILAQLAEDIFTPILVSQIFTKLAAGDLAALSFEALRPTILAIFGLTLFHYILWKVIVRRYWRMQELVMRDLMMTVFNHLTSMSYRFFSNRFGGSLVSQTNKFVYAFERLTDALTWNVFKLVVSVVATFIILLPKSPLLAGGILLFSALFVPVAWFVRRNQVGYNKRWAEAETKRTGQLADTITNIMAVKSFANESFESKEMYKRATEVYDRSMDTMNITMRHEYYTTGVYHLLNMFVVIISAWLAVNGIAQVGVIYLALTYTTSILRRLWDLSNTFRQFTRVFGDSSDMAKILQISPEVLDAPNAKRLRATIGEVAFSDVTFGYPERPDHKLFDGLNLQIKPGEKIGLVGPSGGGKTTITKLLLRFMDIQDGTITVDGQNIAHISQRSLRDAFSYVPQEPLLFHRTLIENISYGKKGATKDQVIAAAKSAHAHDFIMELPDGYDTLVGERGVKLSGGQKQRIAIARAMLREAPILVLDEATSALDSESEVLIQDALWKLMQGRTAIVIAHRLSTIKKMDRIIVLDQGKIAEQGSHTSLIKQNGLYAKLWKHQTGDFLGE